DIAARLALTRRRPATGRGQLNRSIELQLDTECYVPGTSSTSSMSEASYNIALPSNPLDELVLVPPRGATRCFRPARATVTAFSAPMKAPSQWPCVAPLQPCHDFPPQGANINIAMENAMTTVTVNDLPSYIGKDLGHSDWLLIDQERVNQFADCTGDHQFIHIDEEKAKQTPFGGTIAHGFLSLSLIPALSAGLAIRPEGLKMAVNYGLDSVRFI